MTGVSDTSQQVKAMGVVRSASAWLQANPLVWSGAVFAVALASFIAFQSAVLPGVGLWIDELYSLWAGDARIPFPEAFATRILPDTNGPVYFSLIHFAQQIGLEGRAVFLALNFLLIGAFLALIVWRGWRSAFAATALASVALLLVTAPFLVYAPEGRVYGIAMAVCAVLAFIGASALTGERAGKGDLVIVGILSVLAGWLHVFAALFAGSLAAALIAVGWLVMRRRDLVQLGLLMGGAATAAFLLWMAAAFRLFTDTTSWIAFDQASIAAALWGFRQYLAGPMAGALLMGAFVGLSLAPRHSRPIAMVLAVTATLFIAIPFAVSFRMPMFVDRYLLVAGPALLTLVVFVMRSHLINGGDQPRWRGGLAALGLAALILPVTQGVPTALSHFERRPDWRGSAVVLPIVDKCPAGEIRTLTGVSKLFGFEYYLDGRLTPVPPATAPLRDVSTIDCPVYGWAEHYHDAELNHDWHDKADMARVLGYFRLTNATGVPLQIIRHRGGLVLARVE